MPEFVLGVEICEDLWAPVPPSCAHALAGATVVANLSASDETVGKAEYRRALVAGQSARVLCGYLYADAGHGESTTDMTFAGHDLIAENGALLAEAAPFGPGYAAAELDLGRMAQERMRNTTFAPHTEGYTLVPFDLTPVEVPLTRAFSTTPFVPQNDAARAERCELILRIQAEGLAKRIEHTPGEVRGGGHFPAGWIPAWRCWRPCAPAGCWGAMRRTLSPSRCPVSARRGARGRTPKYCAKRSA